jgi:hypothetical protein
MEACKDDEKLMTAAGWKSWSHAFTRCGPHFDFLVCVPEDLMHDFFEGITKGEVAHFIFYCERIKEHFTLDDLNRQLDMYQFPDGGRPVPYFTDGFMKGEGVTTGAEKAKKRKKNKEETEDDTTQDGVKYVPKAGAHVHMTAGQMLTFVRHSFQIFLNLGVPEDDPALQVWQLHVTLVNLLMQHSLSLQQVAEIDALIVQHQEGLAGLSRVYPNIWKPKHHYICHFPLDILHFGPPRHYWCMRFEALNQVFKRIAVGGSYRDTTRRLAEFWCMRSALARQRQTSWEDWATTRVVKGMHALTCTRETAGSHVVDALDTWPTLFGESVTTSLISELQHNGRTITTLSWLYLTLDTDRAETILASLHPHSGIFSVDSGYFFHLVIHPNVGLSHPVPLRSAHVPASIELQHQIVSLDEIVEMHVLWPCASLDVLDGKLWHFTEM